MGDEYADLDARLEAVETAAAPLPSRLPRVRDPVLGRWMAYQMDALLRNVTAGYGALDVAIGESDRDARRIGPPLLTTPRCRGHTRKTRRSLFRSMRNSVPNPHHAARRPTI